MKLTELSAKWIEPNFWEADRPFYIGVSFLCPHCDPSLPAHGSDRRRRFVVMFWPPVDATNIAATFQVPMTDNGGHRRVSGETLDTLTLSPSVGLGDHWHGFITNGELCPG